MSKNLYHICCPGGQTENLLKFLFKFAKFGSLTCKFRHDYAFIITTDVITEELLLQKCIVARMVYVLEVRLKLSFSL